jgi:uncharacterized repeat protein (TIGR01451 family)
MLCRRSSFNRLLKLFSIALLLSVLYVPVPSQAQEPEPTNTPIQSAVRAEEYAKQSKPSQVLPLPTNQTPAPTPETPSTSQETTSEIAAFPEAEMSNVTGTMDVRVNPEDGVQAGNNVTYTFEYRNTGSTALTNPFVDVRWVDFLNDRSMQQCATNCAPQQVENPASITSVEKLTTDVPGNVSARYRLNGTLQPNQTGRFAVVIRINFNFFPKTKEPIFRPSGSGQLMNANDPNNITLVAEDTAATIIVGPVLVARKRPINQFPILPSPDNGQNLTGANINDPDFFAEFALTVGNATNPEDQTSGPTGITFRGDARPATNVTLYDIYPPGAAFADTPNLPAGWSVVENNAQPPIRYVKLVFNGVLAVGQTLPEVRIRYRKLDNAFECGEIGGNVLATSNEFPLDPGTTPGGRKFMGGDGVNVRVAIPLEIRDFQVTPSPVMYNQETTVSIKVFNKWLTAVNGLDVQLNLPINTFFVPGSATSSNNSIATVVSVPPDPQQPSGSVNWLVNMPPRVGRDQPSEITLSFKVRADYYSRYPESGNGQFFMTMPVAAPPAGCMPPPRVWGIAAVARLRVEKVTDASRDTFIQGAYRTRQNSEFNYIIRVTNRDTVPANNIEIQDILPSEIGANFSYIEGSARLNGQPFPPASVANGLGGKIIWRQDAVAGTSGVTVPANSTVELTFRVRFNGITYVDYCNVVVARIGEEDIDYNDRQRLCVRFNPDIKVTKSVDRATAQPGEKVRFTITLKNNDPESWTLAPVDELGPFIWEGVSVSGYAPPSFSNGVLSWPLVNMPPGSEQIVVFEAKVPTNCVEARYVNKAIFKDERTPIFPIPDVIATVDVNCRNNIIEYEQFNERSPVSLADEYWISVGLRNLSALPAEGYKIRMMLPPGVRLIAMDSTSQIRGNPAIRTVPSSESPTLAGYRELTWTGPRLSPDARVLLRVRVKSPDVVGRYQAYSRVDPANGWTSICIRDCLNVEMNVPAPKTPVMFSTFPVSVEPLITIAPNVAETACAKPGDLRTYTLTIQNTNFAHGYNNTLVNVLLPPGLRFNRVLNNTAAPALLEDPSVPGLTFMQWRDLRIPAKPDNQVAAQVVLVVELKVGQVFGNLSTVVQTSSPNGLIPRKEGVEDPTISVCVANTPAIFKDAVRSQIKPEEEIIYVISLANPTDQARTITIEDVLPSGIAFTEMVEGNKPQVNGQTLRWTDITLPAKTGAQPAVVTMSYRAKGPSNAGRFVSTATVTASTPAFNGQDTSSVEIFVASKTGFVFFPIARR